MKTILVENIPRRPPEIKGSDDPASVARLRPESPAFLGKAAHDLAILHGFIIAPIAGILAILVHAISERSRQFYEERRVRSSPMATDDA